MKRLGVDPACGVLDPKEATLMAVSCDAFAYGQEDTNNDRITIEWTNTPDGAGKQFREWFQGDGMVRRKNIPIEYNPCGRDRKRKKSEETVENKKKKKIGEIALSKFVDNRVRVQPRNDDSTCLLVTQKLQGGKCQSVISPPNQSGGLFVPQGTRAQARRSKVVDATGYPRGPVISPPDQSFGHFCSLENPLTSPPVQSGGTFRKQRDPVINLPVKRGKISRNKRVTVKTPTESKGRKCSK